MPLTEIRFLTKADQIRHVLDRHRTWIEQQLGCKLEESLAIETEDSLVEIGAACILHCDDLLDTSRSPLKRLRAKVTNAFVPEGMMPRVYLESILDDQKDEEDALLDECFGTTPKAKNRERSVIYWQDVPIAIQLADFSSPLIVMHASLVDGSASSNTEVLNLLVTRQDCTQQTVSLLEELTRPEQYPRLVTLRGNTHKIASSTWSDLVLDPKVSRLLKDDFEFFSKNAEWFRRMNLPHRRGYLLHGPPGNGKTSAIRCLLSSHGLTAYTIRLFDPKTDDAELDRLFEKAMKKSPSVVLFEDLDRAYPRTGAQLTHISLQHFLNTLDGVTVNKDIVVIATANEPSLLDPAILRRPGRFDRSICFPNPSEALRLEYYERLDVKWPSGQAQSAARLSDGLSFAQLKESYILGAQHAFGEQRDLIGADIIRGLITLKNSYERSSRAQHVAGFTA